MLRVLQGKLILQQGLMFLLDLNRIAIILLHCNEVSLNKIYSSEVIIYICFSEEAKKLNNQILLAVHSALFDYSSKTNKSDIPWTFQTSSQGQQWCTWTKSANATFLNWQQIFTLASTIVTSIPKDCNCRAAVRPEIPEPTTITLGAFFTKKNKTKNPQTTRIKKTHIQ